ncbi:MAG: MerR family transcriptional regulator [Ktedonobacteraceae bacterium]
MDDKSLQGIKQHLQDRDAQNRILKNIERARSETTVTIGRAASLFDFTENQLRDWEVKNRLTPTKSAGGQRLYPLSELDKLAIIRELLDAKFSPGDIPENIDAIWNVIRPAEGSSLSVQKGLIGKAEKQPIDQRVEQAERDNFWRYFVSQVMRLSLLLICEDIPDTIVGMILPLRKLEYDEITDAASVGRAGPSLIGWLPLNRAFYSFFDTSPSFEYSSDFRVEQFRAPGVESSPLTPLIIVQRRTRSLFLSARLVQSVQRFLTVLHYHINDWLPCFDYGMRDFVYQVADFARGPDVADRTLNDLMNRVVELGGKTANNMDRWRFCGLLLPQDGTLPIQQRNLEARVHSEQTPARWNTIVLSKNYPGLSFRAYQSGHVIYRPDIPISDQILPNRETEESTRSAIAIPVAGENGMAVAALYIASDEVDAFSQADQRALRLMTRMIEELLATYQARQQVVGRLANLINNPGMVDLAFREFLSEDDFINDLETFLKTIQTRNDIEPDSRPDPSIKPNEAISFIVVDIDNQGSLAAKYGDQVARNLSREVGLRIRGQLRLLSNPEYQKLYHVNADSFYMKLVGMPLDEARNLAQTLYTLLGGDYRIDARRVIMGRPMSREDMLELPGVSVRLGVSSYQYSKLKEILQKHPTAAPVVEARDQILSNLDESLKRGQMEGGDAVFTWDYDLVAFVRWVSSRDQKK